MRCEDLDGWRVGGKDSRGDAKVPKIRAESVKEQCSHLVDLEQFADREDRWRLVDTSAARMVQTCELCLGAATEGKLKAGCAATMNSDVRFCSFILPSIFL